jgi:hypothetical protein
MLYWLHGLRDRILRRVQPAAARGATVGLSPLFDDAGQPTVLVTLLALAPAERADAIKVTAARLSAHYRLVYLTDDPDFTELRNANAAFEYLPGLMERQRHRPDAPWDEYMRQRYQLLLAKWAPVRVMSYGLSPAAFELRPDTVDHADH